MDIIALFQKCKLAFQRGHPIQVKIANGDLLTSDGRVTVVPLWLQGTNFNVDFITLPLGGYDVVLGIQWLQTFGPILWDFANLIISFAFNTKPV